MGQDKACITLSAAQQQRARVLPSSGAEPHPLVLALSCLTSALFTVRLALPLRLTLRVLGRKPLAMKLSVSPDES